MVGDSSHRPSPTWGFRQSVRLWRLVVACWVVSIAAWLPAVWVVGDAVAPALSNLPDDTSVIPAGEVQLLLYQALRGVVAPFKLAVLSGLLTVWTWIVLWHAGLVGWQLWAGGRRVRLGEVLGLGMVSWWRYARLSAVAFLVLMGSCVALWSPLMLAVETSYWDMAEHRVAPLLAVGFGISTVIGWLVWAATLRAAWLLGLPERRSAALAWLRGLVGTLWTPIVSLGTVAVWTVPALLISLVPLGVGLWVPSVRAGWTIPILGQLAALACAFCWVGLFASFAPVTGLVGGEEEEEPDSPSQELGDRDELLHPPN